MSSSSPHGKNFIEFFRCGHCKKLAPIFIEAATALAEEDSEVKLADVDCTVHKAVCSKYGVKGYPTVMFFDKEKSEPVKFTAAREKQAIITWIKEQTGAAPEAAEEEEEDDGEWKKDGDVYTLTEKNFARAVGEFDHVLVKFYAPWCGHCKKLAPIYKEAATALGALTEKVILADIDCTTNQAVCGKYGVKGYPTVQLFSQGADEPVKFTAKREKDAIIDWLKEQTGFAGAADENNKEDVGEL